MKHNDKSKNHIGENSYYDTDYYIRIGAEYSDKPENNIILLLEKIPARKRIDVRMYNSYRKKLQAYDLQVQKRPLILCECVLPCFSDYLTTVPKKETFNDVLSAFQVARGLKTDAEICRCVRIDQYKLARMRKESRPVNRDVLWRLAISLRLDPQETEKLFNSAGESTHGNFHLTKEEKIREIGYEYFIKTGEYDFNKIIAAFEENNLIESESTNSSRIKAEDTLKEM